ncbi:class I SAM-dependent methyltransferase [Lysinibacillus piscis]|uniref:Methyltransferase n=1 Tax=Lysinibacillus piscis TaxID=2518931 RepID=A0ABQ5NQ20_9BACI|nr:class I SAM-dependent methyltransferase [Lysinibacillus sp. KH24]GLC90462.1 methyltransferase [Lysinibacillus sp. KH24]
MENKLFSHVATAYAKARPTYSEEYIHQVPQNLTIAEFGAGTGKLTKQLLETCHPKHYVAIEPNQEMVVHLKQLQKNHRLTILQESAEHNSVKASSIDLIVVAQAFHWFDPKMFLEECRRILVPNGKVHLIWNKRKNTTINKTCEDLFTKYCPDFKGFGGGIWRNMTSLDYFFKDTGYTTNVYDHPLLYDKEAFITRNLSGSYIPTENTDTYMLIKEELEDIYIEFLKNNTITLDNEVVVYQNIKNF